MHLISFFFIDTCYVLSFAVIMLNTSLHNPNVKDKPPVQRFTAMNRGINDGGDLPEELLRVRNFNSHNIYTFSCFNNKKIVSIGPLSRLYRPLSVESVRQHQERTL